jgi:hypothetical protein
MIIIRVSMVVLVLSSFGMPVAAQQSSSRSDLPVIAVKVMGLASIQPSDTTYAGGNGPYLGRGLGERFPAGERDVRHARRGAL